jgi:predicted transcriptional regulator of viral defense system
MTEAHFIRSSKGRERLSFLLRKAGPIISVGHAAEILNVSPSIASMTLSKWAKQGWLKRLKRGFYAPVSIEASSSEQVLNNVWVLVPELFSPAYIGGWSAAEHWGFTEQVFQSICVVTSQNVRRKKITLQNVSFYMKHVDPSLLFGLKTLWDQNVKIQIADPHKTIIDMLDDPAMGGGIHHVDQCLRAYLSSDHYNEAELLEYAEKQNNGALFKRLGYLLSLMDNKNSGLISYCKNHITKGISSLEPGYKDVRFITEWGLSIPKNWQEAIHRD